MNTSNTIADEGDTICPPWWPENLWALHFPKGPINPGGPVNMPAAVNQILLGLQTHTSSYYTKDLKSSAELRKLATQQIEAGVRQLAQEK
jgi:hypothetical protein